MNLVITLLLALVLLLAPSLAALPDEPVWSSWLSAGTMLAVLLAVAMVWRGRQAAWPRVSRDEAAFLVLLSLAFLSLPMRLLVQHGTGYLGPMLRGWSLLATDFALYALARRLAAQRLSFYGLILAAIVGAAIVAEIGVREYVPYLIAKLVGARVFATSTPDYLAGYFVLLLPVTLALFLEVSGIRGWKPLYRVACGLIVGLVLLFELVSLLATLSRFSLVSLTAGMLVFAGALTVAWRHGYRLGRGARQSMLGIGLCLLLAGARLAGTILVRLHTINDNSAAFRVWTWKGAIRMAAANPLLGTGIGTWPDLYPPYALTGFTRLAHNAYLQMADECGIPALLALLAILGLIGAAAVRGLSMIPPVALPLPAPTPLKQGRKAKHSAVPPPAARSIADFLPTDHRLLLCGLLAALAGGMVQNLIDSDWFVFFLGSTFWLLAGLAAGRAAPVTELEIRPVPRPALVALGSVAAALLVLTATEGIAAFTASQAQELTDHDPAAAAHWYDIARAWDPLSGRYPSDQGYKIYGIRLGNEAEAETALRTAVALEPNSVNYRRLGTILQAQGRPTEARTAYEAGLRVEPNSIELLLDLARLLPPPQSLDYYRRISELELTPVGTVRALDEYIETKFAVADAALGAAVSKTDKAQASAYYGRAAGVLEKFANRNGSLNGQRQALNGGHPDPRLDAEMRGLYQQVMAAWISLVPADQQPALRQRQVAYLRKFDHVLSQSSK